MLPKIFRSKNIERTGFLGKDTSSVPKFLKTQAFLGKKCSVQFQVHIDARWRMTMLNYTKNGLIIDKKTSSFPKNIEKNRLFLEKKYFLRSKNIEKTGLFSEKILPLFQKYLKNRLFLGKNTSSVPKKTGFFGEKSCSV